LRGFVAAKGNCYYAVVELPKDPQTGRRQRKWHSGYRTKREAERALADIVASLGQGTYVEPHRRTLGSYLTDEWLPSVQGSVKANTLDAYKRSIERHVLPRLGNIPLLQLTPIELNRMYSDLAELSRPLAPKSIRNVHAILHKALTDAAEWNLIPRNPASAARPPRNPSLSDRALRAWRLHELRSFLESVRNERLEAAWVLLGTTGMRRGELLGLRWEDVDLRAGTVRIVRQLISVAYQLHFDTPKSTQSRRVLSVDERTLSALRAHRARQGRERMQWGSAYEDHGLVFARENGEPIHPDSLTARFKQLITNAGLRDIRLHDLRHTYATVALEAGVAGKVVSERLGHSNVAFTLNTYAHVSPVLDRSAADNVAALIFGP
jgi:integrase